MNPIWLKRLAELLRESGMPGALLGESPEELVVRRRRPARADRRPAVFEGRGVTKVYPSPGGPVAALREASFAIEEGVTALLGGSGSGKTTILNILGSLDVPTGGQVLFHGEPVPVGDELALGWYRSEAIAWVFQDLQLIGHQTVEENAALPLLLRRWPRSSALEKARHNLDLLGVGGLAGRKPGQLSRGQKQRVAIARGFTSQARVILADEPTGSLDPETAQEVMDAFLNLSRRLNKSVVLVTHDHRLARQCDHILLCRHGKLVKVKAPEDARGEREGGRGQSGDDGEGSAPNW